MEKLKYCIECHNDKPAEEFKGTYFCRACKEKYGEALFMEKEPPLHVIFTRIEQELAKYKPNKEKKTKQ